MPNYQGTPRNLIYEKPKWKNLPTVAIRIPEKFKEQILAYARKLDEEKQQ